MSEEYEQGISAENSPPEIVEKLKLLVPMLIDKIDLAFCYDDDMIKRLLLSASINIPEGNAELCFPHTDGFTYWVVKRVGHPIASDNGFTYARWNTAKWVSFIRNLKMKEIGAVMMSLCVLAGGNTKTIENSTMANFKIYPPRDN